MFNMINVIASSLKKTNSAPSWLGDSIWEGYNEEVALNLSWAQWNSLRRNSMWCTPACCKVYCVLHLPCGALLNRKGGWAWGWKSHGVGTDHALWEFGFVSLAVGRFWRILSKGLDFYPLSPQSSFCLYWEGNDSKERLLKQSLYMLFTQAI